MNAQVRTLRWLGVVFLATLGACGGGDGDDAGSSGSPGTIQLLDTSFDATEGSVVNILVARSAGSSGLASVDYAASGETAVAGTDFPATSGTLTFADGVSGNQTISITLTDDNTVENSETLTVTLSNVSGASLGANTSATVSIIDNDVAVLPITADNARAISASVMEAIVSTVEFVELLDIVGIPAIGSANSSRAAVLPGVIVTESVPCDTGEATVTWDDADNNLALSTGDTFDIVLNACFFADTGATLTGASSLSNLVVTGDPVNQIAPWRFATTIAFEDLSATDGAGTTVIAGSLNVDLSSDDNVIVNLSVGTDWLSAQQSGLTETLTAYTLTQTLDAGTLTQEISTSGTLTSTSLEGTVSFETPQPFIVIADDNPSAGQLLVSDSGSSVLVTVLDNINVQLEIDFDLDGSIDETIVVSWSEFLID